MGGASTGACFRACVPSPYVKAGLAGLAGARHAAMALRPTRAHHTQPFGIIYKNNTCSMNVVTVDWFEQRRKETGLNGPDIDDFWRLMAGSSEAKSTRPFGFVDSFADQPGRSNQFEFLGNRCVLRCRPKCFVVNRAKHSRERFRSARSRL